MAQARKSRYYTFTSDFFYETLTGRQAVAHVKFNKMVNKEDPDWAFIVVETKEGLECTKMYTVNPSFQPEMIEKIGEVLNDIDSFIDETYDNEEEYEDGQMRIPD